MATLPRELRRELERTAKDARRVGEAGRARRSIGWGSATPGRLRGSHPPASRSANDSGPTAGNWATAANRSSGKQLITSLVAECAYENWHRMLFARFLAENDLLIEPELGVTISLDDCKELARSQGADWLDLASSYAARILPQIFRPGDPVLDVSLPPETRSQLEDLLKALPTELFQADDSLGLGLSVLAGGT